MKKHINTLSVDLESWVHKYFLENDSSKKKLRDDGYIRNATLETLEILKKHNIKTTFFVVGEIFDWYPDLMDKISEMGHEIGFHTYNHCLLLNEKTILNELNIGKKFIEKYDIKGFRAPEVIMKKEFCSILKDWGFIYDSSIYSDFKILEPVEGFFELPVSTYPIYKTHKPIEFPRILTLSLIIKEIPFGSGYFIGLFGSNIQWFIKQLNKKNKPANLFIHPWQIKKYPKINENIKGNIFNRIKMIPYNINRRETFEFLCQNYEFVPMIKLINYYSLNNKNKDCNINGEKYNETLCS